MTSMKNHFERAKQVIPGGINSSVRVNSAIGLPLYASSAKGSRVRSIEGKDYIDMNCSHGAAMLGHSHPAIDDALRKAIELGYAHSFETEYHEELARLVCEAVPCADKVRFCSSGSEATLHMIRACRAYTGRNKIIRFEGHFHGYHELIYIGGHPPRETQPENRKHPYIESPGIPVEYADHIIPLPFNDTSAFEEAIDKHGDETALVILEPVNYNCGCIMPELGYLEHLRTLTREKGIVLFFDEVQSSFKKSRGGCQEDFGIIPDVCTIGKALGGGLPLSAFCGRAEIMDMYQPVGPVQHSGTFNGHIVPVLAGLAFMKEIAKPSFYQQLSKIGSRLDEGIASIIDDNGLNMIFPFHGARFNSITGRTTPAIRYEDTFCHDSETMLKIYRACWERGVYFHDYGGGPLHHGFSIQHSEDDIDRVLSVLGDVLPEKSDKY